jgi:glycine hydroxymethyltransferase
MNLEKFNKTAELINDQNAWRDKCINLIASENVQSRKVRAFAGSDFTHRYAEGHPGERYYKGTNYIDQIENDLKHNLKNIFKCEHTEVRPISGTNSNEAIFSKFVNREDIVMANSTPGGGHISHHRLGALGKFTKNIIDFPLTADGYHLDIEKTKDLINKIKPNSRSSSTEVPRPTPPNRRGCCVKTYVTAPTGKQLRSKTNATPTNPTKAAITAGPDRRTLR